MYYDYVTEIKITGTIEDLSIFKTNYNSGWEMVCNKNLIAKLERETKLLNEQSGFLLSQGIFKIKAEIEYLDRLEIKSTDHNDMLTLGFGHSIEGMPAKIIYEFLSARYPTLRFNVYTDCYNYYEIFELEFENGKIVKHTHDYIDDEVINNKYVMKHIRKDVINNTIQVVHEQIDEIEESVDAPEKEVLPSTKIDSDKDVPWET